MSGATRTQAARDTRGPDALEALFTPRSIAVIGASPNKGSITGQPIQYLLDRGYGGRIYPVNPKFEAIAGLRCYPAVSEIPEPVDLAVIIVAAQRVPDTIAECGAKGIRTAIIISSGFAEAGDEGAGLQSSLVDIARRSGMRLVGPNCQGMLNVADNVCAGFGPVLSPDYGIAAGPLSFVTQSGGFGFGMVNLLAQEGIGFRRIVSTGNEADLTATDFIEHLIDDPGTRVIACYLEGLRDGRRLADLAAHALRQHKPLLLWKVGRSDAGKRAVSSHTGNLAGDAALCSAVFRQMGAIEVSDVSEVADYTRALQKRKRPEGNRVAIFSASGGAGVLAADGCAATGLAVLPLSEECRARLVSVAPALGTLHNPIDVMGRIFDETERLRLALQTIAAEPEIDSLIVISPLRRGERAADIARAIREVDAETDKPVFMSWAVRRDFAADALGVLREAEIPVFDTPVRCARALAVLTHYADARRRSLEETVPVRAKSLRASALPLLRDAAGSVLSEHAAKRVLQLYGIPVTEEKLAHSAEEAVGIARALGVPVAMKTQSADIAHKTEAGAVRLNVSGAEAVRRAYAEVMESARRYAPDACMDGVLVQAMVTDGIETILGVVSDASFGPVLMFGTGGIHVEIFRDVSFRIPPLTHAAALEMIRDTKGHALLLGARGAAPADVEALADVLVKLGDLALDLQPELAELDINPLAVLPQGRGVVALDALMRVSADPEA